MGVETRSRDCLNEVQGQQHSNFKICSHHMGRIEDFRSTLLNAVKLVIEYKALRINHSEPEIANIFTKVRDGSIFEEFLNDLKIEKINKIKSEAYSKKIELTKQIKKEIDQGKDFEPPEELIEETMDWWI